MITPHYNDELIPAVDAAARTGRAAREHETLVDGPAALQAIRGDARGELSMEQIGEIRQRIRDGVYNARELVDQVAQRMLGSGDLALGDE